MSSSNSEPIVKLEQDRYSLAQAAFYLSKALHEYTSGGPNQMGQVIAISGDWGSGKSSLVELLRMLYEGVSDESKEDASTNDIAYRPLNEDELRKFLPFDMPDSEASLKALRALHDEKSERNRFVEFNAWTGATSAEVLIGMIDAIADQLKEEDPKKSKYYDRRRFFQNHGKSLVDGAIALATVVTAGASILIPGASSPDAPRINFEQDLEKHVADNCKFISEWLDQDNDGEADKVGRKIYLVVDDIDRMPPDRVEKLILSLRWLRTIPHLTTIMIFDHDLVVDGLARTLFAL